MATYSYFRSVNFSSDTADYDLMTNSDVRAQMTERLGISDSDLTKKLNGEGIKDVFFQIYCSDTAIAINDGVEQALTENAVFSSGDFVRIGIKSIKIKETGINGTFRFNIL